LFFAGLTTLVTAWAGWFSFRRQWLLYQSTLNKLYKLQEGIQFRKELTGEEISATTLAELHDEYQAILDEGNREWVSIRSAS
jgi:hypothetical protein